MKIADIFNSMSNLNEETPFGSNKVNILITGATGSGKSSTINALLQSDKAKVGQGVNPETMSISKYELNNIILYDSAGLGDGKEADRVHSKNIIDMLYRKDSRGDMLIDLVLVILDGSTRDLGTSFELINSVIIPNLGEDSGRLLVAINKSDMAMSQKEWNHEENTPSDKLVNFLNNKVKSTKERIKEATGVDTDPVYYVAGYKGEGETQSPYNLTTLMGYISKSSKSNKRKSIHGNINDFGGLEEAKETLSGKIDDLTYKRRVYERESDREDRYYDELVDHRKKEPSWDSFFYKVRHGAWEDEESSLEKYLEDQRNVLSSKGEIISNLKKEIRELELVINDNI